MILLRNKVQQ